MENSPTCVRSCGMNENNEEEKQPKQVLLPLHETRSFLFELTTLIGTLSTHFMTDHPNSESCTPIVNMVLSKLVDISHSLAIDLPTAIAKKLELNRRKYPVHLCQGKAGKYTEYSDVTGITKESQSTLSIESSSTIITASNSIYELTLELRAFCLEREWSRFHLPRNLMLAFIGELGELAELVQWKDDEEQPVSLDEMDKLGQELADLTIYLVRLADVCGVELEECLL